MIICNICKDLKRISKKKNNKIKFKRKKNLRMKYKKKIFKKKILRMK